MFFNDIGNDAVWGAMEILDMVEEAELTKKEINVLNNIIHRYERDAFDHAFKIEKNLIASDADCLVSDVERTLTKMIEAECLSIEEDGLYLLVPYGSRPHRISK